MAVWQLQEAKTRLSEVIEAPMELRQPDGTRELPQRNDESCEQVGAGREAAFRPGTQAPVSSRQARNRRRYLRANRSAGELRVHTPQLTL